MSYIRGNRNRACCDLIDWLKERGIVATVGHKSGRRERTLYVYCHRAADVKRVPAEWEGWTLRAETMKASEQID